MRPLRKRAPQRIRRRIAVAVADTLIKIG